MPVNTALAVAPARQLSAKAAGTCAIANYLRISVEDAAARDESNSIKNQRDMIRHYVVAQEEFEGATMNDYVDDGISGSHTDREAYQRLLTDVGRGMIDCIIVKDLSRIGRNLIDVDDLLMNYLVTPGVRFIAINNDYDSFKHPLSTLELAFINLANQHYNRDLAQKSMSAKLIKAKRGEYLSLAPFGYMKSDTQKNKLVIDEEAAAVVRLIFSLAAVGRRTVEIAQILNAQGIPSPSVYKISKGYQNMWTQVIDEDYCFWTNGVVRKLLMNEVYLGKAISNRFKVTEPGTGHTAPRPKEEWIVVPGAHEAIISESDFQKAQAVLPKKRYDTVPAHVFGNKIKCPACGHAMKRYTRQNPRFTCGTVKFTDHYGCRDHTILQSDIEKAVIAAIRAQAATLLDQQEMKLALIQKRKVSANELQIKVREAEKSVTLLRASLTKVYTALVDSKISEDVFLHKKSVINETIARKESAIERMKTQIQTLSEGRAAVDGVIAELTPLLSLDSLNRDIVNLVIDKILVHGEGEIDIVWNDRFMNKLHAENQA